MLKPKNLDKAQKQWNDMRKRAAVKQLAKKKVPRETRETESSRECKHPTCGETCRKKKPVEDNGPLVLYFKYHIKSAKGICENCGAKIPKWQYGMTQAHILPKRDTYGFPSVKAELDNHMELCVHNGCHPLYDNSWEDAQQMPVFVIAKQRFLLFYHKIAPEEKSRIPACFTT